MASFYSSTSSKMVQVVTIFLSLHLLQPRSPSALPACKLLWYYFFTCHLRKPQQGSGQSALWSPLLFNLPSRWNSLCKGYYYLEGC